MARARDLVPHELINLKELSMRSDGTHFATTRKANGQLLENAPPKDSWATSSQGRAGLYVQLAPGSRQYDHWTKALGTCLARGEMGRIDIYAQLVTLPEGYTLWLKLRTKTDAKSGVRTDTYLYGLPGPTARRYVKPGAFLPHLIWLWSGSQDPRDCSCQYCNAQNLRDEKSVQTGNVTSRASTQPNVQVRHVSIPDSIMPQGLKGLLQDTKSNQMMSQELKELLYDAEPKQEYLYRPGEMVWFCRGTAWGLAVISQRELRKSVPRYLVQPLSYPGHNSASLVKEGNDQLRPWLAWSIPDATHERIRGMTYSQVDWGKVAAGAYGPGETEVDAMIMAAKVIDGGYSLFEEVTDRPVPPGEKHYNGIFLGAEKIWVKEPVRLPIQGAYAVVLVVEKIILHTNSGRGTEVTFYGDVYKFREMPGHPNRLQTVNLNLPPRMIADLQYRNQISVGRGHVGDWSLIQPLVHKTLNEIKGRWYETEQLLPILKGETQVKRDQQQGITSDTAMWMNSRGDTSGPHLVRKDKRRQTLGQAVPDTFRISKGLDSKKQEPEIPDASRQDVEDKSMDNNAL